MSIKDYGRNMKNFKNILIFGHSNIGDVCYDLVVIRPLRKAFPQARISFITSAKSADAAKVISGIDEVIVFDKNGKDRGMLGYLGFISRIRSRKFDLGIILRDVQMHYFFNVPLTIKPAKSDVRRHDSHIAQKYLDMLEVIGIEDRKPGFDFKFTKEQEQFAQDILDRERIKQYRCAVGIMPFAAWLAKAWPIEHWNKLIELIASSMQAKIFVFGKSDDSAWCREFFKNVSPKAVLLTDKYSLSQTLSLVKHMNVFISPDTSLLHLASCMGVRTIGLYGTTDENFIYPLFDKEYIARSEAKLDCMPCYPGKNPGSCGVKGEPARCMQELSVEQVFEKIKQALKL